MRPTVEEQLLGTCRILDAVVSPCVTDPYARTLLEGLIGNLRMLTSALPAVPGFLRSDNRATAELLGKLRADVAPELAASIALALAQPEPDTADMRALDQRNVELRGLFTQALCDSGLSAAMRAAALAHMSARAAAAPMRYVSTTTRPTTAPAKAS
ncbi:MAG: hypothetical protein H7224_07310 [Polaromonas sp.]|nr:hypothetical protein [Polaromonas sp.]